MAHEITIRDDGYAEAVFALQPAWHGLGVVFDHAMTSAEALHAAGLDWSVEVRPVAVEVHPRAVEVRPGAVEVHPGPVDDAVMWRPVKGYRGTVRSDNGHLLGIVGRRYRVVQNREAFAFLDALVDDGSLRFEAAFSLRGGRKVVILARMPGVDFTTDDDATLRYILLSLSHDGTESIRFGPTAVRVVCANTYALANRGDQIRNLTVPHRGPVDVRLRDARLALATASEHFRSYMEQTRRLASTKISDAKFEEVLAFLFPAPTKPSNRRSRDRMIDAVREAYYSEPRQNIPSIRRTAWAGYCAVSEAVDHASRRGKTPLDKAEARLHTCLWGPGHELKETALQAFTSLCA